MVSNGVVDAFIPLADASAEDMLKELGRKAGGDRAVLILIDGDAAKGDLKEIEGSIRAFSGTAKQDIIRLVEPKIAALTDQTVKEIKTLSELKNVMLVYEGLLPDISSAGLSEMNIYAMRINNLYREISTPAVSGISDLAGAVTSKLADKALPCISIAAASAADLRFIANSLKDLGISKEEASRFLQVRLRNGKISQEKLAGYISATGITAYLSPDNIVTDTGAENFTRAVDMARHAFPTAKPENIIIADTKDLIKDEVDNALIGGKDSPVFIQMASTGISSQLFWAALSVACEKGEFSPELGTLTQNAGHPRWYIYIPNVERIDMEAVRKEMENYEKVLSMA
jgi:hypothetical protein